MRRSRSFVATMVLFGLLVPLPAIVQASPAAASTRSDANLITNGGFEKPSIWQSSSFVEYDTGSVAVPGWTVGRNSVDLVGQSYIDPESGHQSVDLSGSAPGSVSQSVATTTGKNYTLTWFIAGSTNCGQVVKTMDVFWDGTLIDSPTFDTAGKTNQSMGWTQLEMNVTAVGSTSVVEFADATPDMSQCGSMLDSVSLTPATHGVPSFTNDAPGLSALQGSDYSAEFFATSAPTYTLSGAPAWLTVNSSGAVNGTPPTGTTSFTYSVIATNSYGKAVAGPFKVEVQPAATVSGTVTNGTISNTPVPGAYVTTCAVATSECEEASSSTSGTYSLSGPVGVPVVISAYPPPGSGLVSSSTQPVSVPAGGLSNEIIALDGTSPLPTGLEINGSTAPTVYWSSPSMATYTGCPNGIVDLTIVGQNTQTGLLASSVVALSESPAGSGTYVGTIPPQEPVHGPVDIEPQVWCPSPNVVTPSSGTALGGNTVLLTGSGFTGATSVTFGGKAASSFTVSSDSAIQATAPPGEGSVSVDVVVGGSIIDVGPYNYVGIQSIDPSGGSVSGGTTVVISGYGLGSTTAVDFGGTPSNFTIVSDNQVDATSPPGSGSENITVTTIDGVVSPTTSADVYVGGGSGGATGPSATSIAPVAPSSQVQQISSDGLSPVLTDLIGIASPVLGAQIEEIESTTQFFAHPSCTLAAAAVAGGLYLANLKKFEALFDDITLETAPEIIALFPGAGLLAELVVPFLVHELLSWFARAALTGAAQAALAAVNCPGAINFDTRIDPSGTVFDTDGAPISGATVTILRASSSAGPFIPVPASSPGIEPDVNPETTSSDGVFDWDVYSGWYEIEASAPGCTAPGNASQSSVVIGPYPVPPPQDGLTVTLACPDESPPPAPSVQSLTLNTGPPTGNTTLMVLGTGFTTQSRVLFGAIPAESVTYLSSGALLVQAPAGSGTVNVTVDTASGNSSISSSDQFTYFFGVVTTSLPTGSVWTSQDMSTYLASLFAAGGNPPYKWSLAAGSGPLPPGLRLTAKGVIKGKATAAGNYTFTVKVVDKRIKAKAPRNKATATLTITIS